MDESNVTDPADANIVESAIDTNKTGTAANTEIMVEDAPEVEAAAAAGLRRRCSDHATAAVVDPKSSSTQAAHGRMVG